MENKSVAIPMIPIFSEGVSCGFPSPAQDYVEGALDLNELLITKPAATFFVRAKGDSMLGAGIFDGDLLIVDRSIEARHNHVVLACLYGDFTLKTLIKTASETRLVPQNPKYRPIVIAKTCDLEIWGVVTYCVHKL